MESPVVESAGKSLWGIREGISMGSPMGEFPGECPALRTQADCGTTYKHTTCAQRDALRVALRVRGGIDVAKETRGGVGWGRWGEVAFCIADRCIAETRTSTGGY